MSFLGKIFGQTASGENGAAVFGRMAHRAIKEEASRTRPWEAAMITGMGLILGLFVGTGISAIHTAVFTETSIAAQAQEKMNAGEAAPGAMEGSVAGALLLPYALILHGSMREAVRETRRQLKPSGDTPKP